MQKTLILIALVATTVSGCVANDGGRAAMGAAAGVVASKAFGGSTSDALLAGAAGAAAGALCDDAGFCQ